VPSPPARRRADAHHLRGLDPQPTRSSSRGRPARDQALPGRRPNQNRPNSRRTRPGGAGSRPRLRPALPSPPRPRLQDLRDRRAALRGQESVSAPDRGREAGRALHTHAGAERYRQAMRPGVRDRPLWRGCDRERREGVRRGHGQYPWVQGRPGCTPSPGALLLRRGRARRRRKATFEREQKGFEILSLTRKVTLRTSTEPPSTTKSPPASHTAPRSWLAAHLRRLSFTASETQTVSAGISTEVLSSLRFVR